MGWKPLGCLGSNSRKLLHCCIFFPHFIHKPPKIYSPTKYKAPQEFSYAIQFNQVLCSAEHFMSVMVPCCSRCLGRVAARVWPGPTLPGRRPNGPARPGDPAWPAVRRAWPKGM
eukprot:EG_transcript_33233